MKIWYPNIKTNSGADVYVERLSQAMTGKGHDVEVSWYNHAFEVFPFPLLGIRKPVSTNIIHANSWSAFAFNRQHAPLVVTMHHSVHDPEYASGRSFAQSVYHRNFIYHYERLGIEAAAKVVAVSNYTAKITSKIFQGADVITIPNGIDTDLFRPLPAQNRGAGKYRLLFVGNPSRRKGFDFLVKIMERLGPSYWLYYTDKSRKPGSGSIPNSTCLGRLGTEELVSVYQECDTFIFPTRYEGFGFAVAEAMACQKPVVTSDISALPELVTHGKNGLLCPVGDIESFVDSIKELRDNRDYREALALEARKTIVNGFSEERMINSYEKLYQSLVQK